MSSPISNVYQGPQHLEAMVHNKHVDEEAKLKEVSIQFEGLMLRQFLKESLGKSLTSKMPGGDIYQGVILDQLADSLSRSNQLGLAEVYESQLQTLAASKKLEESGTVSEGDSVPLSAEKAVDDQEVVVSVRQPRLP